MGDVVNMPREPGVFQCDCGCRTFFIREDATFICAGCDTPAAGTGIYTAPDASDADTAPAEPHETRVYSTPDISFARMAARVKQGEFVKVIGLKPEGGATTVGETIETAEQRSWLRRQMVTAYKLMAGSI